VAGRPRKPSYEAICLVINECTKGPRTWTQLLTGTGLHRNTLSKTCGYLVDKKVLRKDRTVRTTPYSINEIYLKDRKWQRKIELPTRERAKLERYIKRRGRAILDYAKYQKRFSRYFGEEDIFAARGWRRLRDLQKRPGASDFIKNLTKEQYAEFIKLSREIEARSRPIV